jgi:hypothetical protein
VVDPVEELLQVYVDGVPVSFLDVLLGCLNRLVCAPPRPEAVTVLGETRVKDWGEDLQKGLLDQSV